MSFGVYSQYEYQVILFICNFDNTKIAIAYRLYNCARNKGFIFIPRHKIGHFGDDFSIQSLGSVLKIKLWR